MGGQQGSLTSMMLPLAMFVAIFYFMIIRPQKKKQKAHDEMLASISRGDTVVTAGGFFGVVREMLDDSYIIELDAGVKARILKSSVSAKITAGAAEAKPKKKKVKKAASEESVEADPVEAVSETQEPSETVEVPAETTVETENKEEA